MNNRTIILLLLLLTLSVYANSLTGEFVWDDDFLILENPSIMSLTHVWTYFVLDLYQSYSNYYRPIQALSNAVDFALWGANPFGFHLTNVLLHMAVIALYFGIVNFIAGDRRVASVAAALFAVHPAHVAVVAYIAGRADALCALFMLLSLIFFYRHFTASRKDGSLAQYILSLAFFIFALMSKEIAVIFPAVILLCRKFFVSDNMAAQSRERIRFHYLSWYVIVAAVYSLLRVYALNFSGTDMFISGRAGLYSRLLTSMQSLISYLGVLFAPVHLSMDRSLPPAASFWGGWVPFAAIGLLAVLWVSERIGRISRTALFGVVFFFVTLVPVCNIVPLSFTMAEHWLYFPSMGILLTIAVLGVYAWDRRKWARPVLAVMLAVFVILLSLRTAVRNRDWRDNMSIFTHTLRGNPLSIKSLNNIGNIYSGRGEHDRAIRYYDKALLIDQNNYRTIFNLGRVYEAKGMPGKALEHYLRSAHIRPDYSKAHFMAGNIFVEMGDRQRALKEYELALRYFGQHVGALSALGGLYLDLGLYDKAEEVYKRAIDVVPHIGGPYSNLANVYAACGRGEDALGLYAKAVSLDPENADHHYNMAMLKAQLGAWEDAKVLFEDALQLRPRWLDARINLGSAYYCMGKPELARREWKIALKIDPENGDAIKFLRMLGGENG